MIVRKPEINIERRLAEISTINNKSLVDFWFVGDGAVNEFNLPLGFKPYAVYNDGVRAKKGDSDQYIIVFDGFIYSVLFLIAPSVGADICIDGERT